MSLELPGTSGGSEPDLLQLLLREGLIQQIPSLEFLNTDVVQPIEVGGKPLSEEIIEDRR